MSKRTPNLLLEDILDAANKILDYTSGMSYEEFYNDNKSVDAVCRNFEIIGERQIFCRMDFAQNMAQSIGTGSGDLGI
jgi:uncharacterized protein with HEPN domain